MDAQTALHLACVEARKWLGVTSPNPPVGAAALDAEGNLLAVTAHHKAGEAHAEAALLALCHERGTLERIHTLCVTLEPCNHYGRTPPCTRAIIAAGIKHVVIGARDPNPDVKGGGADTLRAAGIEVSEIHSPKCLWLTHAFMHSARTGMPWVTVKRAFQSNGSMVPPKGQKTFTSPASLKLAHQLRKKADAILTSASTILADNPEFTVRHVPEHYGKRRWLAIIDRHGRIPQSYIVEAEKRNINIAIYTDIAKGLQWLNYHGARDVLVEAGPTLSTSILESGLWAMAVDIKQTAAGADTIDVRFNPSHTPDLQADTFDWNLFLPAEDESGNTLR